jgi:hypothetical protein
MVGEIDAFKLIATTNDAWGSALHFTLSLARQG